MLTENVFTLKEMAVYLKMPEEKIEKHKKFIKTYTKKIKKKWLLYFLYL